MPAKKNFDKESIKKIHTIFKELRERTESPFRKALSQRELATEIGVAHSRISKLEAIDDETEPSISDLLAYRSYFNVTIDYLLGLESDPSTDVDLRSIAKDFGLTARSIKNLRESVCENRTAGIYNGDSKKILNALNIILESDYLPLFLKECDRFFNYFPKFGTTIYAFSDGSNDRLNNDFISSSNKYVYKLEVNVKDFMEDYDKNLLLPKDFQKIIADNIITYLFDIRMLTKTYNENCVIELERIKKIRKAFICKIEKSNELSLNNAKVLRRLRVLDTEIRRLEDRITAYNAV